MSNRCKFLVLAALMVFAVSVNAGIVTVEVTAEVSYVEDDGNHFNGDISVGDTLTMVYSFDTDTPDSYSEDYSGIYNQTSPCGVVATVGGYTFQSDQSNLDYSVSASLYTIGHTYFVRSANNVTPTGISQTDYLITWQLDDSTKTALTDDSLPTVAPNLNDWTDDRGIWIDGLREFVIVATPVSVRTIPEPATMLMLGLGGLLLRKRTS